MGYVYQYIHLMAFYVLKWMLIVGAVGVANYMIFGKNGVLIPLGLGVLLLILLYTFQNKLLYMPGKSILSRYS